jgi:hypothetical protein
MLNITDVMYEYDLCVDHVKDRNQDQILDPVLFGSVYQIAKTYRNMIESKYKEYISWRE